MDKFEFDSAAYLQRVSLSETVTPTAEGLRTLQRAHFSHIPFENFDIQLGRGIDLEPAHLFDKLVRRQRGGYCFELNGLFFMALRAFGFEARPLLARVHVSGGASGRGHQITLVDVDGRQFLTDVGFGKETPRGPVLLERDLVQDIERQSIRLIDGEGYGTLLQVLADDEWRSLYSFDMEHVFPGDIDYGNHFTSTSPRSFFTSARVATRPLRDGMAVLFNNRLTFIRDGQNESMELPEGQGYIDALEKYFGIELDASYEDLKPIE